MLKLLIAGRRASSKTREAALRHLRTVHGPLVYDAPADAGAMPARYVQNHVFEGPDIPALRAFASDRDLVTEIWFESFAHLVEATQTPYYKTILQPDESNFVDQASVRKGAVLESAERGVAPPDAAKLFVFLKRNPGISAEDFDERYNSAFGPDIPSDARVAASVMNTPLPPPGGGPSYVDGVAELWFADRAGAESFCRNVLASILVETLAPVLDAGGTSYVLVDAYPVERLRATTVDSAVA